MPEALSRAKAVPLSALAAGSRDPDLVMCFEGVWSDGIYKTYKDFLEGTATLRRFINSKHNEKWLLYCEDCWLFLLALTALLQCKKEVLLATHISPAYIAEIHNILPADTVFFLTTPQHTPINSSIVRDILRHKGDASIFIPPTIYSMILEQQKT